MTDITYGAKYEATRGMTRAQIAKLFRADVKAAIASGALPLGLKLSVKTHEYAGGGSIDVTIKDLPAGHPLLSAEDVYANVDEPHTYRGDLKRYAPAMYDLMARLDAMLAAYNFDGSDSMTDHYHVRFGGGRASVDHALEMVDRAALLAIRALGSHRDIVRDAASLGKATPDMVSTEYVKASWPRDTIVASAEAVALRAIALLRWEAQALDARAAV